MESLSIIMLLISLAITIFFIVKISEIASYLKDLRAMTLDRHQRDFGKPTLAQKETNPKGAEKDF